MNWYKIKENLINGMRRFMYGRNGFDALSWVLFGLAIIMSLVARFTHIQWFILGYYFFFVFCILRVLSRNIQKRQQENRKLLGLTKSLTASFKLRQKMLQERNTFVYLKCPSCKQQLRVPKGKGKISIKCSKCHTEFIRKV